ncbi:hypothetical protein FHS18_004208 [Paenibacillus phyllosphaerae]|uniref:SLH domain-containing protein n=1 Tax=Paenibacillus phyllosphaerae TaxID=274593 RepID=A0A7W5B0G0_9BACL|nr:S-layer homology domain-containing protein [Paenibacillus phyllosphaerae]MBB3112130.1 hypothetical protein [Paenibacillus phyllosphaerae]
MKGKLLVSLLVFLLINTGGYTAIAVEQQSVPRFELSVSRESNMFHISVIGYELKDMYAFEIMMEFDSKKLRFIRQTNDLAGYSITPPQEGNTLTIAHTKIGQVTGESGRQVLTQLEFERMAPGTSTITLQHVKLVDSKLDPLFIHLSDVQLNLITHERFLDIEGHWAESSIMNAWNEGFIEGYADGTFRPRQAVRRAEFAAMIVRALQPESPDNEILPFVDGRDIPAWAIQNVQAAVQEKWLIGFTDGTFRPAREMTRAELAVIVDRVLDQSRDVTENLRFTDVDEIPRWAKTSVDEAVQFGLMQGTGKNRFSPNSAVTRAEAVTVIMNILEERRR